MQSNTAKQNTMDENKKLVARTINVFTQQFF